MLTKLLATDKGLGMLWVRIPLGLFMVHHGYEKVINPVAFIGFCDNLGIPPVLAVLSLSAEFFGGLGVLLGGLTRIAALGVGITMFVAAMVRHVLPGYGVMMNYHATLRYGTEGYEIHTLAVGMSLALVFLGAGSLSLDRYLLGLLARHSRRERAVRLEGSPAPIT
jgi:putative oxidoreductase